MENVTFSTAPDESKSLGEILLFRIRKVFSKVNIQRRPRRLKLCETLSLGEKRILALVECENRRFLVAATPQSISLLQTLDMEQAGDRDPSYDQTSA